MFTIIGADGKEYGPVTAAYIKDWIAGGRANLQTKACRAGETEWRTLGEYAEFGGAPASALELTGEPPLVPVVLPAATAARTPLQGTPAEIAASLARNAEGFDFFSCLSRSFELWKTHFLALVGITLLSMVIQMLMGFIPVLGAIGGLLLSGVFTGGIYYYYLGKIRGEPRQISDVFAGFNKALGPLILTNLVMTGLLMLVILPFTTPFFLAIVQMILHGKATPVDFPVLSGLAVLSMCLGLIPIMYLSISWIFAFALVIDQGLGPWTALEVSRRVVTRRWFSMFGLVICGSIIAMFGLILLFVGFIIALPILIGSILYAYEDLCQPPKL